MFFRFCRYRELVEEAYLSYGKKWCDAYQVGTDGGDEGEGFGLLAPQREIWPELKAQYDAWEADMKGGKKFATKNNCPIPFHKDSEGWFPKLDPFTHGVRPTAACAKMYTWPLISAIWPTMDTLPAVPSC